MGKTWAGRFSCPDGPPINPRDFHRHRNWKSSTTTVVTHEIVLDITTMAHATHCCEGDWSRASRDPCLGQLWKLVWLDDDSGNLETCESEEILTLQTHDGSCIPRRCSLDWHGQIDLCTRLQFQQNGR